MERVLMVAGLGGCEQGSDRCHPGGLDAPLQRRWLARGFMLDAMKTYGPDSLTGQLSCLFQGAAETTFYVVALLRQCEREGQPLHPGHHAARRSGLRDHGRVRGAGCISDLPVVG
jgi:hypothetical protein